MHYVYLIKSTSSDAIYIGYTTDLRKRVANHIRGIGSDFTSRYKDWQLVYYEAYRDENDARNREKALKSYGQSLKHLKNRLQSSLIY